MHFLRQTEACLIVLNQLLSSNFYVASLFSISMFMSRLVLLKFDPGKIVAQKLFFKAYGNNHERFATLLQKSLLKWQETRNHLSSPAISQILNSGSAVLRVEINEQLTMRLAFILCPWEICTVVAGICAGKHTSLLKKAVWLMNSHEFSQKIAVNKLSQLWCIKYVVALCRTFQWCLFTVATCLSWVSHKIFSNSF